MHPWEATKIRYIKLGKGGEAWERCKKEGIIILGFHSGQSNILDMMKAGEWESIKTYWKAQGAGTATQHTNAMKEFYYDAGDVLWITFADGALYYTFSDGAAITPTKNKNTFFDEWCSYRRCSGSGWSCLDSDGIPLSKSSLNGNLTRTEGFRATICRLKPDAESYLRKRLQAVPNELVTEANIALASLQEQLVSVIRSLTWQDFELLVDLIFVRSGWNRTSIIGKTQKYIDIEVSNSITGEVAFVQVKSATNQAEFDSYLNLRDSEGQFYDAMFYVYHTSQKPIRRHDEKQHIYIWGASEVAEQAVRSGLTHWLIEKAK